MDVTDSYPIDRRNRVVRRHERGRYDRASVHAILDAALLAHIAYVIDGQPYCTPTAFWREGDHLYWHGSSASRMVRFQSGGVPVCVTVTHLDGLVLARSGFAASPLTALPGAISAVVHSVLGSLLAGWWRRS